MDAATRALPQPAARTQPEASVDAGGNMAGSFTAGVTAVGPLPHDLPRGLFLREVEASVDYTLSVALPEAGPVPAAAHGGALAAIADITGPRLAFVAAGADADLRLAVIPDSLRPDALWVPPGTGVAEDLSQTPSVFSADKDARALAEALDNVLTTKVRAINLLKLGDAVGEGCLDVHIALQTRAGKGKPLMAFPRDTVARLWQKDEVLVLASNNPDAPVDVKVLHVAAHCQISQWFSGCLQPGDALKTELFMISDDSLGCERMIVLLTPAKPPSSVEDLGFLSQDEVVLTRGGSSFAASLRAAGFGQTIRGALALDDETDPADPAPGVIQIEVRTVPAG